jgi:hypothetical protein
MRDELRAKWLSQIPIPTRSALLAMLSFDG